MKLHYVLVLDTETTGLGEDDEVIEVGLVLASYDSANGHIGTPVAVYTGLRQPRRSISPEAFRVHGIEDQEVTGRTFDEGVIKSFLVAADLIVAHNAKFDRAMIAKLYPGFAGKPWACTMRDIDWYRQGARSRRLTDIAKLLDIEVSGSHRALSDAMTVLEILKRRSPEQYPYMLRLHRSTLLSDPVFHVVNGAHLGLTELSVQEAYMEELLDCPLGARITLWSAEEREYIVGYANTRARGRDQVFRLLKIENPLLMKQLDHGRHIHFETASISEADVVLRVCVEWPRMPKRRKNGNSPATNDG